MLSSEDGDVWCILATQVSDVNGHLFKENACMHFVTLLRCVHMHFCDVIARGTLKGAIVSTYTYIPTFGTWHKTWTASTGHVR